jgi:sec-independent protein translocase protein TatA
MPGLGGISMWQLLIILVIVMLIFGTKRIGTLGGDVGGAIKSFKKAMEEKPEAEEDTKISTSNTDASFSNQKDKENQS